MIVNSNRKLKKDQEPVFVERPVPSERQVEIFERAVRKEARQEEIDNNLSEIYRDKEGNLVDVSHLHHEKRSVLFSVIKIKNKHTEISRKLPTAISFFNCFCLKVGESKPGLVSVA